MTPEQVDQLFQAEIKKRGLAAKVPSISKHTLYNWRQERSEPTFGQKLEVLFHLKKIKIKPIHESD